LFDSLFSFCFSFFSDTDQVSRNTVTYFIAGVLFNDFLQNSVNFQSASLFCAFLETDLSFLCLDPVTQLFHLLSPYPFLCDQIAAAGLSLTPRFLSNTSPTVQFLCLYVLRELPASVLESAPLPEILVIVSDLLPDSAIFSFPYSNTCGYSALCLGSHSGFTTSGTFFCF
jgi:hypothetical protein